jgi:protein-S-isoprenylcysteine O-methyltransferase Ste14
VRADDTAGVLASPPLIYVAGLAAGFALEAALPSAALPAGVQWGGGVLVVGGALLLASFLRTFARARTAVRPDRPTTAIATDGPYRFTRNPAYLGMATVGVGISLLADAVWPLATLAVAAVVIDRGVIAREERYLAAKFGDEYRDYRRRVRRWI